MKILILENIRSAYNVGAIFRTADGAGVQKIFLLGYTPTPIDRFGRVQSEIKKTSLGASDEIEWEHISNNEKLITQIKIKGFEVVAIEQADRALSLDKFKVPNKVAYVLGNEVEGVSENIINLSDQVVDMPMLGTKESLNVSVAAGIVLYHGIGDQFVS